MIPEKNAGYYPAKQADSPRLEAMPVQVPVGIQVIICASVLMSKSIVLGIKSVQLWAEDVPPPL